MHSHTPLVASIYLQKSTEMSQGSKKGTINMHKESQALHMVDYSP